MGGIMPRAGGRHRLWLGALGLLLGGATPGLAGDPSPVGGWSSTGSRTSSSRTSSSRMARTTRCTSSNQLERRAHRARGWHAEGAGPTRGGLARRRAGAL